MTSGSHRNKKEFKNMPMMNAPHSVEALRELTAKDDEGDYGGALDDLTKKCLAISDAKPFHVAVLGLGNSYIYTNGVLTYFVKSSWELRILDIGLSAEHEVVIDVQAMFHQVLATKAELNFVECLPLHCAHGILSCCLDAQVGGKAMHYVVVINLLAPRIMAARPLPRKDRMLVRNDEDFLFCCVKALATADGLLRWMVYPFNLKTQRWNEALALPDFLGSEVDEGVCFEIVDGYFYGISNLQAWPSESGATYQDTDISDIRFRSGEYEEEEDDDEDDDEEDYDAAEEEGWYHAIRFPVSKPFVSEIEAAVPHSAWTRDQQLGASDPRWNFLRLEKDEETGGLVVYQIRHTYGIGEGRICFRHEVVFESALEVTTSTLSGEGSGTDDAYHEYDQHNPDSESDSESDSEPPPVWGFGPFPVPKDSQDKDITMTEAPPVSEDVPPSPPAPSPPPPPIGKRMHLAHDLGTFYPLSLEQCSLRSYFSVGRAFVDLVDESEERKRGQQDLRLRSMVMIDPSDEYTDKVRRWPPAEHPPGEGPLYAELQHLMNPYGYGRKVEWAVNGDSFVYSLEHHVTRDKALVYVGFNPTVNLKGIKSFYEAAERGYLYAPEHGEKPPAPALDDSTPILTRDPNIGRIDPLAGWAWKEVPLYRQSQYNMGFDFLTKAGGFGVPQPRLTMNLPILGPQPSGSGQEGERQSRQQSEQASGQGGGWVMNLPYRGS